MIYISYEITKSASTFSYVLTETVLRVAGFTPLKISSETKRNEASINYVDPMDDDAFARITAAVGDGSAVIKTHGAPSPGVLEAIENGRIFASAIIRDPREIALSLIDHSRRARKIGDPSFPHFEHWSDTLSTIDDQFHRLTVWLSSARVLLLTYEEICFETVGTIASLGRQLDLTINEAAVLKALPPIAAIEQYNKGVPRRFLTEMTDEVQKVFLKRYEVEYRRYAFLSSGSQRFGRFAGDR